MTLRIEVKFFESFFLALLICGLAQGQEVKLNLGTYLVEPAVVVLKGEIKKEMFYGPPNFGEDPKTDEKIYINVLVLDKPINVKGDSNSLDGTNGDNFNNVKELQIDSELKKDFLKKAKGHQVKITGTLSEALVGSHDYKDVLISINEIEIAK